MAERKGDGIFVFAVLVLAALMLVMFGFAGLGGDAYSVFAPVLLVSAGGISYFAVKGAHGFGAQQGDAIYYAAGALMCSLLFTAVLFGSVQAALSSVAGALAVMCAAPLAALWVRGRASGRKEKEEAKVAEVSSVQGVAEASSSSI